MSNKTIVLGKAGNRNQFFPEENLKPKDLIYRHRMWRFLEIIPGALTWAAFIIPVLTSIYAPTITASFIIVYTITWLFRSIKLSINLYRSFGIVKNALQTDWERLINLVDHPEKIEYEKKKLEEKITDLDQKNSPELKKEIEKYENLQKQIKFLKEKGEYKKSKNIIHAVLYVTYKESYELIRESIRSYTKSKYPSSKIILVFAGEERDKENVLKIAKKIESEFGKSFLHFMITLHPANIPGEIKGKSANATYAAKELKKYLEKQKINFEHVILSNFDADTVVHPLYFTELTYKYLISENRTEKAYQPTHMFHNNIWDVPIMNRMVAISCTFWRMAESMDQEKYKSFSSRSINFQTLIDVNYWDPKVIPEDSRQYWTAFFVYNGRHRLVPIYCPIYMDAVLSETYVKTFQSQYKQLRRWAWGVCDFPFIALNLWHHPHLKKTQKIYYIAQFLENSFFWATGPILLSFLGYLPGTLNAAFRETVLAYNLPRMMSDILMVASGGIIICAFISLILVPYKKEKNVFERISLIFQWLLVPVVSIILSAIPAVDAQTRLIFGKYLEYQVTEKARK